MTDAIRPPSGQHAKPRSGLTFWPSIRLSIPVVLILFAVLSTLFSLQRNIHLAYQAAEQEGVKDLTLAMTRMQSTVEFLVQKNEMERVRSELVALGTQTEIQVALLLDDKRQVLASLKQADVGKGLDDLMSDLGAISKDLDQAMLEARIRLTGTVGVDSGGESVTGIYPVVLGVNAVDLRPKQIGILFVQQSLIHERAVKRYQVEQQSLQFGGFLLLLTGLLWIFLHFGVARRANHLVLAAGRLSSGDSETRVALDGADEFARIGTAFDEMAAHLQEQRDRLVESEALLNEAQHIARVGSWELDLLSGELYWSDEIFNLFELDKTKFGATYEAFLHAIHPHDRDDVNAAYTRSLEDRTPYTITHRLQMNDGRVVWVEERCNTDFDGEGKPLISRGTVQDVTERKLVEEQLEALNVDLETRVEQRTAEMKAARDEAERSNVAKSEFLSRMSHELRTPMNAILGFAQLLELSSAGFDENQRGNVKEIIGAGYHLLSLINEVLDLARIESGKMEVSMEEVSVDDVLRQSISLIASDAKVRQLSFVDHVSGDGYTVHADFTRLKQVFLNLFSNAVKYNREQGSITVNGEVVGEQRLRISIADTGEGLSEDDIAKLFTPFERLNNTNVVDGVGIGLVITKHLVELMGGAIGVKSVLGKGSIFWLELGLFKAASESSQ